MDNENSGLGRKFFPRKDLDDLASGRQPGSYDIILRKIGERSLTHSDVPLYQTSDLADKEKRPGELNPWLTGFVKQAR